MELKTARLTLLIDPNKKAAFERLCARQDRTASQVVRQLIRDYLAQHGVECIAAGRDEPAAEALAAAVTRTRHGPKRAAAPAASARLTPRRR